jgi:pimeloyl-ACP methyl ester carboxylesterase
MTPLHLLRTLFGLLSLFVLAAAVYLIWTGYDRQINYVVPNDEWRLWLGWGLLALSFLGRFVWPLLLFTKGGGDRPPVSRGEGRTVVGPDGSELRVETFGREGAPTLVLTHGWGLDSTVWRYARADLADRFRLIVWDLPGLGKSKGPGDGRHTLERYAENLRAVTATAGGPVVLVGHSIGGMTIQTLAALHPELLGSEVKGIVLLNTTHLRPIETTAWSGLIKALWPVLLSPVAKLMIVLEPLFHLMAWQSYLSGNAHMAVRIGGFGKHVTRSQLEHTTFLSVKHRPGVQAKGDFAMMDWDVTKKLPSVRVPTLVVVGERDLLTRPDAGERIAALIPGARLERMEGCGHMGFYEYAEPYNRAIAGFAEPLLRGGANESGAGAGPAASPGASSAA